MESINDSPPPAGPPTSPLSSPSALQSPLTLSSPPYGELGLPSPAAITHERKRRRRRTTEERLNAVLLALTDVRWTLGEFLLALYEFRANTNVLTPGTAWLQFLNFAFTDLPVREDFESVIGGRRVNIMNKWGWAWASDVLRLEIKALADHRLFGPFHAPSAPGDLGSLESLQGAPEVVTELAPQWLKLIERACVEARPRERDAPAGGLPIARKAVVLFAKFCNMMRPNRSNNFQTVMGLYLYQGGTRRRVMETLGQLGLVVSYRTILRRMEGLVVNAESNIRRVGQAPHTTVSWDNFEFTERKRGERIGDEETFRSITTALIIDSRLTGRGPLLQAMWQPEVHPLSAVDFALKLHTNDLSEKIRLHHIESAIKIIFPTAPPGMAFPWGSRMPILEKLPNHKTKFLPLRPIMRDESTTSNNIQIIENIFQGQINLGSEDPIFASEFRMVGGDLKTWSRIHSAKSLRAGTSKDPYDSFRWVLPTLGLWHLRLNLLQLIHKIHWGEVKPADPSTLQYAADRWGRSGVVQGNNFQAVEELIIHSYQSRIIGVLIRCLRANRVGVHRHESVIPWLAAQRPNDWESTLRRVSNILLPPAPTAVPEDQPPILDEQFHNHQVFCSHVEIYLSLRYAIKHADIGLLRLALRHSAVIFQAAAAGTPKYARALFHTLHLVDSPAADIQLQEFILANSLVNLRGAADSNFELDRLLELLNNSLKAFQQERSYFSKYSDDLLQRWALNAPYLSELKAAVESNFGRANLGRHPTKAAVEDIWGMATNLATSSLRQSGGDRFSNNPATNLWVAGLGKLADNLLKYNNQYAEDDQLAASEVTERPDLSQPSTAGDLEQPSPTLTPYQDDGDDLIFVE